MDGASFSLASNREPNSAQPLLQALRALRAPVREVHLDGLDGIREALEALAAEGLPPSWKVLTLEGSWGDDDPEAVRALLQRHASALGTLEVLGLPDDCLEDLGEEGEPVRTVGAQEYRERFLPAAYRAW